MLDAFDECNKQQQGRIVSILRQFEESEIRVYVTTRDHLSLNLLDGSEAPTVIKISATDDDVQNFIAERLKESMVKISDKLKAEIVERISADTQGM